MKFEPLGKKIYLILDPVEEAKSKGGVYLPEMHVEHLRFGTVMGVGDRVEEKLEVGDRVLVGFQVGTVLYSPTILKSGLQDTHRIVIESEIWFKVIEE